jgi:hypothetical protein
MARSKFLLMLLKYCNLSAFMASRLFELMDPKEEGEAGLEGFLSIFS